MLVGDGSQIPIQWSHHDSVRTPPNEKALNSEASNLYPSDTEGEQSSLLWVPISMQIWQMADEVHSWHESTWHGLFTSGSAHCSLEIT